MSFRFNTRLRPAGVVTLIDPDSDKPVAEYDTLICCHCGCHFRLLKPGKTDLGTVPGHCAGCGMQPVCGRPSCLEMGHVPQEVQLEAMEQGVNPRELMARVSVAAPGLLLP